MNRTIAILLAIPMVWSIAISQQSNDLWVPSRDVSVFMSLGYLEYMSLGISLQASDQYSIGLVSSFFVVSEKPAFIVPDGTLGVGVRSSYYFSRNGKFLGVNAIIADVQYLIQQRKWNQKLERSCQPEPVSRARVVLAQKQGQQTGGNRENR